jgi:hypothetical protein
MAGRAQRATVKEDLAQGLGLVGDPGVESSEEGFTVYEVILQGEQAEQQALGRGNRWFTRTRVAIRIDAESSLDGDAVVGEPCEILIGTGLFTGGFAELALHTQQFFEQKPVRRAILAGQIVLNAGALAPLFPFVLKLVGSLVEPGSLASLGVAHKIPFGCYARRSNWVHINHHEFPSRSGSAPASARPSGQCSRAS